MNAAPQKPLLLPPLREELHLLKRGMSRAGAPVWTLYDPVANNFFRIGWLEFELLSRWRLGNAADVLAAVARETTLHPDMEDMQGLLRFLGQHQLLKSTSAASMAHLVKEQARSKNHPGLWLLKNYLFLRIPLIHPDAMLSRLAPRLRFLFSMHTVYATVVLALLGMFLVSRDWSAFVSGFHVLQTAAGAVGVMGTLIFAKCCHEMGHALTSKYFGCRVPTMGVAFTVMWPMLWTDTTDAWRLTDRRQRMAIDAAGMIAELALAATASIAWVLLPDGALRTSAHMLASTTWVMTLFVNLNPLMRFDGYYIFADLLDIPNVQPRSFALARWWLRRQLWGLPDEPPETFPPRIQHILLIYGIACWIYRFFLFVGLAAVVYHFFFKLLGVFLFAVEIVWFIMRPILQELRLWKARLPEIRTQRRARVTAGIALALCALFILPVSHRVNAPAMLRLESEVPLTAPHAGKLEAVNVKEGNTVAAGQVLFSIVAPDVEHDLQKARIDQAFYAEQVQQNAMLRGHYRDATVAAKKLAEATAATLAHEAEEQQMVIKAPEGGCIVDIPEELAPGTWVSAHEPLGFFVNGEVWAEAFVTEDEVGQLQTGNHAWFVGADGSTTSFTVISIGGLAIKQLPYAEMASTYKGPISVQTDPKQKESLLPEHELYQVLLRADANAFTSAPPQMYRGVMHIEAKWSSPLWHVASRMIGLIIRESGW